MHRRIASYALMLSCVMNGSCALEVEPSSPEVTIEQQTEALGATRVVVHDLYTSSTNGGKKDNPFGDVVLAYPALTPLTVLTILKQHFKVMQGHGPDAEARYQASLSKLREASPLVIATLQKMYDSAPSAAFDVRWAAIQTVGALNVEGSVPLLLAVASATLPYVKTGAVASDARALGVERVLRAQALSGLSQLAQNGVKSAKVGLSVCLTHPDASVRREAIAVLVEAGRKAPSLLTELGEKVPVAERALLTVRPQDIRAMAQPALAVHKHPLPSARVALPPAPGL